MSELTALLWQIPLVWLATAIYFLRAGGLDRPFPNQVSRLALMFGAFFTVVAAVVAIARAT